MDEFRRFSDVVEQDVYDILSLQSCLDKRCAKGGVSPLRIAEAIAEAKHACNNHMNSLREIKKSWDVNSFFDLVEIK